MKYRVQLVVSIDISDFFEPQDSIELTQHSLRELKGLVSDKMYEVVDGAVHDVTVDVHSLTPVTD